MTGLSELSQHSRLDMIVSDTASFDPGTEEIRFRDYRLLPSSRILLKGRAPVPIGSRAFDILSLLASLRGTIVGKNEIVKHVWPTTFVEESNLRFQVAQLRKALGADQDLIKTIPGRGYLCALEAEPDRTEDYRLHAHEPRSSSDYGSNAPPVLRIVGTAETRPTVLTASLRPEAETLVQQLIQSLEIEGAGTVVLCVHLPHGRS